MKTQTSYPEVVNLHNLRPDALNTHSFRPLGKPRLLESEGFEILCSTPANDAVITRSDGTFILDCVTGNKELLHESEALCAATVSDRRLIAFTADRPLLFKPCPDGKYIPAPPLLNDIGVSVVAYPMSPVEIRIDTMTFSREYTPGTPLAGIDREKVLNTANEAYQNMANSAAAQGVFVHPVLVRTVILDETNQIIYRGPVTLVMPPEGIPFDNGLSIPMDTRDSTLSWSDAVPSFRLKVNVHPSDVTNAAKSACYLGIEVYAPFHQWLDKKETGAGIANVVRNGMSDTALQIVLPGSPYALSANDPVKSERLMLQALADFDKNAVRLSHILITDTSSPEVIVSSHGLPAIGSQSSVSKSKVENYSPVAKFNLPHAFVARCVSSTPAAVVYSGISRIRFNGFSPLAYASHFSTSVSRWKALTTVTYADGAVGRHISQYTGLRPTAFTPFIHFPDGEAQSLDISIFDETEPGICHHWHFVLQSDISDYGAFFINRNLQPIADAAGKGEWDNEVEESFPVTPESDSLVLAANAKRPLEILVADDIGSQTIHFLPAKATSSAWDFGRNRFICFTKTGVHLVNISSTFSSIAVSPLSLCRVEEKGSTTTTDTGASFFIAETGIVYKIDGTKISVLCDFSDKADRIGFDPSSGLLTVGSTSGNGVLHHIDPKTGKTVMTSSIIAPFDAMVHIGPHLLYPTQSGLFDIALARRREPDTDTEVSMVCHVPYSVLRGLLRLKRVTFNMDSLRFEGRLIIERHSGAHRSATAFSLALNGKISTPFTVPVMSRPLTGAVIRIEGAVSPETRLSVPSLSFESL